MRPGSPGIDGTAGAPKVEGNGPGMSIPDGGGTDPIGGPGGSKSGPSPIMGLAPARVGPPPQLLQHSHGQAERARNILIR